MSERVTARPTSRTRSSGAASARREPAYPTSGSSALQVDYGADVDEPIRSRTAEERDEADRRAAERAANRAAGRADVDSRRRLRVAPPLPVTVARAPFVAMLCVVVVTGVVGILVLTAKINANQFRLNNLQSQQAGLNQQEQSLQATLAQQQSPGNLIGAAKKLGLVPAGSLAFITLPNGKVYGLPQPASKVPSVTAQTGAGTTTPSSGKGSPKGTGTGTGAAAGTGTTAGTAAGTSTGTAAGTGTTPGTGTAGTTAGTTPGTTAGTTSTNTGTGGGNPDARLSARRPDGPTTPAGT